MRKRKRVKTDPADAYELANLLRLGSLPEAYIAPPDLRELRELVRHRRQLVKLSTSVKAGMRALLAKHNIRLAATQLDSDTATGLLDALVVPGTYATRLASQRRLMLVLADEIASVEVELHARLRHHDPPTGAVEELNGLTTPDHRGSRTASCTSTRRNGWQLRLSTLGPPETEADHHNYTADDAGEQSVRRPRDVLNTVRPRASRSGPAC